MILHFLSQYEYYNGIELSERMKMYKQDLEDIHDEFSTIEVSGTRLNIELKSILQGLVKDKGVVDVEDIIFSAMEEWTRSYLPLYQHQLLTEREDSVGESTGNRVLIDRVKELISETLKLEKADKVGLIDYASLNGGGSIINAYMSIL